MTISETCSCGAKVAICFISDKRERKEAASWRITHLHQAGSSSEEFIGNWGELIALKEGRWECPLKDCEARYGPPHTNHEVQRMT